MTASPEVVWVHRGEPVDVDQPMCPCTIHDLRSRRCRYQVANRHLLAPLKQLGGMAQYTAVWCPEAGTNGRWQLIDVLPENVTVIP